MFAIGGCVPAAVAPVPLKAIPPSATLTKNYKLGVEQTAGIGDPIVDVESATAVAEVPEFVALRAHDPGRVLFLPAPIKLKEGDRFRVVGKLPNDTADYVIESLTVTDLADRPVRLVVTPDGRVLGYAYESGGFGGGSWPAEPLVAPVHGIVHKENAFRAQMIYAGLNGTTVRATYREFAGDLIRAAFTQDLQYNLAQDSTIAYKSIKIQVLGATNSQLRYRVREDGGLPWMPGGGR